MTSDELIAEASRRIAEAAPAATVIVFGSHARGQVDRHSDLDLLVVEPEVEKPRRRGGAAAGRAAGAAERRRRDRQEHVDEGRVVAA